MLPEPAEAFFDPTFRTDLPFRLGFAFTFPVLPILVRVSDSPAILILVGRGMLCRCQGALTDSWSPVTIAGTVA